MKIRLVATPTWTSTFQSPSLAQAISATASAELAVELDRNTMPFEVATFHVQVPYLESLEIGVVLSAEELQLQRGLLSLLAFSPTPDQPTEEDTRPRLEYNFPD